MESPILIVDDEADIRSLLEINLRREGYETVSAATAAEALDIVRRVTPKCILLDMMLPDMAGTELCRQLRSQSNTSKVPIIVVSARGEEIDRVVGFEVGADDYVVKANLSIRELLLRIRAVLRRHSALLKPVLVDRPAMIEFGVLKIDLDGYHCWVNHSEVSLTATEFKLLVALVSTPGRVQTRGHLLEHVWDMPSDLNTRTVDTHVKRLREKIGLASAYILTVRGVGYRFRAPAQ